MVGAMGKPTRQETLVIGAVAVTAVCFTSGMRMVSDNDVTWLTWLFFALAVVGFFVGVVRGRKVLRKRPR